MAWPDRRFPVPGTALGQRADSFRCALLGSSVSMETAEIFRVTVNSLITLFSCHLSLIKDRNTTHPRRRKKQLQSGGKKEQVFTAVVWQECGIKLQCRWNMCDF